MYVLFSLHFATVLLTAQSLFLSAFHLSLSQAAVVAVIKVLLANHYNLQTAALKRTGLLGFIELAFTCGYFYDL